MNGWRLVGLCSLALIGSGCASSAPPRTRDVGQSFITHLASAKEAMCKHCNCLMPAGIDPETTCPVCKCGKRAHACAR